MKQKIHPLCLVFLALALCNTSLFAEDFAVNGIYYNITSETDKTVEVTYHGNNTSEDSNEYSGFVTIPQSVSYHGSTYSVTSIGIAAFEDCYRLTSVEIPNSVTSIRANAFSDCSNLTSIEISNNVTSIGNFAFSGCEGLTSVEMPYSVTSIGDAVFSGCPVLTSITVAEGNPKYDSRDNCNAIIETKSNTLIAACTCA